MQKIKKILGMSLAVLFLLTVTAAAVSATTDAGAGGYGGSAVDVDFEVPPGQLTGQVAPVNIMFVDNSIGGVHKYWDFGDGSHSTSTDEYVWHYYRYPGTYTVSLTESNGAYTASETRYGYLTIEYSPVYDFVIRFLRMW